MSDNALARLQLPRRAMALVLAGGRGSRLHQLTDIRAKPAVYFGGKFRIVDFALSNCLNSGIRRIAVLTQYKSHSLLRHIQRGWGFLKSEMNEFVDLLPAQQRIDEASWYRGTADAVYQNLDIIRHHRPEYILVLAGDHVYKMDYARMLVHHVEHGAPCTVGCIEVPLAEASSFGVMGVDTDHRIVDFTEKPASPTPMPGRPDVALASMGIYLFDAEFLYDELPRHVATPGTQHDFGRDVIPSLVEGGRAVAHPFGLSCIADAQGKPPYWRDVGTLDAYWEANIDLTATDPQLNLYDTQWPIWTYQEQLPPAKFVHNAGDRRGMAIESMVSGGCIISGQLDRSLLFSSCRVHSFAKVAWSVLLPDVQVGRGAHLTRAILDRGCRIPDGMVIGEDPEDDARRFHRTDSGITLVTPSMLERLAA
jgi:glucose-1-phosphate adenylyltransferase